MTQDSTKGPFTPAKGAFFCGIIKDLCLSDVDKWRRREIIFNKCESKDERIFGFSAPGNSIVLIDTDGDRYELRFSKPETSKTVCLGTASRLKPWYRKKGFSERIVKAGDRVHFEYTGNGNEFLLFADQEKLRGH